MVPPQCVCDTVTGVPLPVGAGPHCRRCATLSVCAPVPVVPQCATSGSQTGSVPQCVWQSACHHWWHCTGTGRWRTPSHARRAQLKPQGAGWQCTAVPVVGYRLGNAMLRRTHRQLRQVPLSHPALTVPLSLQRVAVALPVRTPSRGTTLHTRQHNTVSTQQLVHGPTTGTGTGSGSPIHTYMHTCNSSRVISGGGGGRWHWQRHWHWQPP